MRQFLLDMLVSDRRAMLLQLNLFHCLFHQSRFHFHNLDFGLDQI